MVLDSQITEFSIHVGIEKHWGNVCPQFKLVLSQYARTSQKTEGLPVKIRWGGGGSLELVQFVVRLTYTMPQNSCCDIGKKKKKSIGRSRIRKHCHFDTREERSAITSPRDHYAL